jgi:hypothetical protein
MSHSFRLTVAEFNNPSQPVGLRLRYRMGWERNKRCEGRAGLHPIVRELTMVTALACLGLSSHGIEANFAMASALAAPFASVEARIAGAPQPECCFRNCSMMVCR